MTLTSFSEDAGTSWSDRRRDGSAGERPTDEDRFGARSPRDPVRTASAMLAGKGAATVNGPGLPVGTNHHRAPSTLTVSWTSTEKLLATPLIIKARPNTRPVARAAKKKRRHRHWRSRMLASQIGPMVLVPPDTVRSPHFAESCRGH